MPAKTAKTEKPIGAYIRVSHKDQNGDGQAQAVREWLAASGLDLAKVEWYTDVESGRKMVRPAFDRLRADIFAGRVKTVVVYKVDRIARRLREGLNVLCDWCDRRVRFVSITQQIDVSGTMGRMVAALMLGFAEIEWEYRKERQEAGIKEARKKGVYKGRKPGTTIARPPRARELAAKGLRAPEIAEAMGVSVRTVFRYLEA
jgi:DNA invertase Pin-like site-specific DNA recombinase